MAVLWCCRASHAPSASVSALSGHGGREQTPERGRPDGRRPDGRRPDSARRGGGCSPQRPQVHADAGPAHQPTSIQQRKGEASSASSTFSYSLLPLSPSFSSSYSSPLSSPSPSLFSSSLLTPTNVNCGTEQTCLASRPRCQISSFFSGRSSSPPGCRLYLQWE